MKKSFALVPSAILISCASPSADLVVEGGEATAKSPLAFAEKIEPMHHVYRRIGDETLSAFVFEPHPSNARDTAIVLFHGGGYFTGAPQSTFMAANSFASAGITSISIQYRLADESNTPLEALSDACHALRWVRREQRFDHIDDKKVALYGVSAGAHLAANLITHGCEIAVEAPSALLLSSASVEVMSIADRFKALLQNRADPEAHSPLHNLETALPPTAIAHGELDSVVPISTAAKFCARQVALGGKCELKRFPGRGHLMSRNLDQQTPGPGFDPDMSDISESVAFFINFLEENIE